MVSEVTEVGQDLGSATYLRAPSSLQRAVNSPRPRPVGPSPLPGCISAIPHPALANLSH